MMGLLYGIADAIPPKTFWNGTPGSLNLELKIVGTVLVVAFAVYLIRDASPKWRRVIVGIATFVAGGFYVLAFVWPTPINRQPGQMPGNLPEAISFKIDDALPIVSSIANIVAAFLLGLGVYSVGTIHWKRFSKFQRDWEFSLVLLISMLTMIGVGYADWYTRKFVGGTALDNQANWGLINYANDFLFQGLLQQMDAAMFSLIAFYILSAAYRAFRIRSIEATVLLASALVVMLSLMGGVEFLWNHRVVGGDHSTFALGQIADWLRTNLANPAIRAVDFGLGIGALAMGLRLWLSLEKQGTS